MSLAPSRFHPTTPPPSSSPSLGKRLPKNALTRPVFRQRAARRIAGAAEARPAIPSSRPFNAHALYTIDCGLYPCPRRASTIRPAPIPLPHAWPSSLDAVPSHYLATANLAPASATFWERTSSPPLNLLLMLIVARASNHTSTPFIQDKSHLTLSLSLSLLIHAHVLRYSGLTDQSYTFVSATYGLPQSRGPAASMQVIRRQS